MLNFDQWRQEYWHPYTGSDEGQGYNQYLGRADTGYQQYLSSIPTVAQPDPALPGQINPTGGVVTPSNAPNWDIQDAWIPGTQEATQIFNQGLPPLDPNNYLGQTMSNLMTPNPYIGRLNQMDQGNPYAANLDRVGRNSTINPAMTGLMNMDVSNPAAGQLMGMDTQNPFLQQFQNFASQMNPYADQLFDIGADKIRDRINSQFGAAGQGNSALNLDTQLGDLSDFGAQFYGGIYDNQQQRMLDAMSRGADVYSTGMGQGIDALSRGGQLYGDATNRGIDALSRAGTLRGGDLSRQVDAFGTAGGLFGDAQNRRLDQIQTGLDASRQQEIDAATLLPGMLQGVQGQPWSNLRNYADIVSQLTGSSPQQASDPRTSGFDRGIGLLSLLGSFLP